MIYHKNVLYIFWPPETYFPSALPTINIQTIHKHQQPGEQSFSNSGIHQNYLEVLLNQLSPIPGDSDSGGLNTWTRTQWFCIQPRAALSSTRIGTLHTPAALCRVGFLACVPALLHWSVLSFRVHRLPLKQSHKFCLKPITIMYDTT